MGVILIPSWANAATFGFAEEYALKHGETVKSDLYAAGATATVIGSVDGDAIIGGGNVYIGSTVAGGGEFLGGTVDVIGTIGDSARIVSGKSIIRSTVGKDLVLVSGNAELLPQSVVSGDVYLVTGRAVLDGEIKGMVKGVGGTIVINGIVHGDVRITADTVTIGPSAVIDGSLVYSSSKLAVISEGAVVRGEKTFTQVDTRSKAERLLPTLWGTWIFVKFIILLVSALTIQGIFRSISETLVRTAFTTPKWSFVRGFLLVVAVPFALLLVLLTFVGIPFVILGSAAYVLFLMLAYLFSPIVLGSLLFKLIGKEHTLIVNWKTIVVGVCAFILLSLTSWVGTIIQSLLFLITLGAIYHVLFERFIRAREYSSS